MQILDSTRFIYLSFSRLVYFSHSSKRSKYNVFNLMSFRGIEVMSAERLHDLSYVDYE